MPDIDPHEMLKKLYHDINTCQTCFEDKKGLTCKTCHDKLYLIDSFKEEIVNAARLQREVVE